MGIVSYRRMKDRPNISLWSDIMMAFRGELGAITGATHQGVFISFEGGEGSGKSTQSKLLKEYLESTGETVLLTREPGGTDLGVQLRGILLANETGHISPASIFNRVVFVVLFQNLSFFHMIVAYYLWNLHNFLE